MMDDPHERQDDHDDYDDDHDDQNDDHNDQNDQPECNLLSPSFPYQEKAPPKASCQVGLLSNKDLLIIILIIINVIFIII